MLSAETRAAIRRAAGDLAKVQEAPDSTRADGLVTSPGFSGHKTLAALNQTAFMGQFAPALLDELEEAERCISDIDKLRESTDASLNPDGVLDRVFARIYDWRRAG